MDIRDAYVKNSRGERVVDFRRSNLHVVNYSVPVRRTVSLAELRAHCFTLPEHPDWIPYRTSYYEEAWGILSDAPATAGASGRRVRGRDRFHPRPGTSDLWRAGAAGRDDG